MARQPKKNLAALTADLEERTDAVLTSSEIDFTRLVALGDAEKDARKQLVLYEKAKEMYDNPMVQERIDATRQRVPKESRFSSFWRISGYASPAFLVGFGLAFYMLVADHRSSVAGLEHQLAGAYTTVTAAKKILARLIHDDRMLNQNLQHGNRSMLTW